MTYDALRDTIQENNLSWSDIDYILLHPENYETLEEAASFNLGYRSEHYSPTIRKTERDECLIYVTDGGVEVRIEL